MTTYQQQMDQATRTLATQGEAWNGICAEYIARMRL